LVSFVKPLIISIVLTELRPNVNRRTHRFLAIGSQLEQPERLLTRPKAWTANVQDVAEPLEFDRSIDTQIHARSLAMAR